MISQDKITGSKQDFTEFVIKLLDKKVFGVFKVCGDECISKFEFGIKLSHVFGLDINLITEAKIGMSKHMTPRPLNMCQSNSKLKEIFGIDFIETLENQFNEMYLNQGI